MSLDTMRNLLVAELRDLYSAERQLVKALPKLAKAATSPTLKQALTTHLAETRGHLARLDDIFETLDKRPRGKKCKGMEGLIDEGDERADRKGDDAVLDAGIIAAAQRIEHYEIASYGCSIAFAETLGEAKIAALLKQTRDEEEAADDRLTAIADAEVNPAAASLSAEHDDNVDQPR
jgi:ferritin-like metal-binding protein YciE